MWRTTRIILIRIVSNMWLILLLVGCFHNPLKLVGPNYTPSLSPCIDGILVNTAGMGCESLYVGVLPQTQRLKLRCTSSTQQNRWTQGEFYFVPLADDAPLPMGWLPVCSDEYVNGYYFARPRR